LERFVEMKSEIELIDGNLLWNATHSPALSVTRALGVKASHFKERLAS
jgi:hypothetical protein